MREVIWPIGCVNSSSHVRCPRVGSVGPGAAGSPGDCDTAASGLDQPWSGRGRCHVHARDLARRPEPDPLELRYERRLSLDGRRQELGVDPLPATDQLRPRAPGLASRRSQRRLLRGPIWGPL